MDQINQKIRNVLLIEYDALSQKLRNKINDITFLNYLVTNKFSNNSGDDQIGVTDIKRLEELLFSGIDNNKVEKEHMMLPAVLLMVGSKLNTKQSQDLTKMVNIILEKISSLKEECSYLSEILQTINKFVNKDNGQIIDYSNNDELIKLIYSLEINPQTKNELLLQIVKSNATNYKLDINTDKKSIKMNDLKKVMTYSDFNFSLFEDEDKEILVNRGMLHNIDDVLFSIKNNQLLFFYNMKDGKYEYSHELTQLLIESNSIIINDVCKTYLSIGGELNKLSNMLSVFLETKKEIDDTNMYINIPKTTKEKRITLSKKSGQLSKRYNYFNQNIQFFLSNLNKESIADIVNIDNNVMVMEPQKLKARFNLFYKYGIKLQKRQIKTFLKLLYSTSSVQLTNMIDRYIELGFDPITNISYKKGIDDNLSKLSFKFSVDKIYYAKKNGIPVYNDRGNWHYYITVNEENKNLSSNIFPPLSEIRKSIPDYVERYYTYMDENDHLIGSYYNKLNSISDDDFNNVDDITNNDIAQRIIDIFEAFRFDDYRYYLANGKMYISRYKFIRNIKLLQDKINEQNILDIVLLCATNNSILTEKEFKLLKFDIKQILDNKKKVL